MPVDSVVTQLRFKIRILDLGIPGFALLLNWCEKMREEWGSPLNLSISRTKG
jgi:hypothetical protein